MNLSGRNMQQFYISYTTCFCSTVKYNTKIKLATVQAIQSRRWCRVCNSALCLTSATDGGWVFNARNRPLYPRERPGTRCTRGLPDYSYYVCISQRTVPPPKKNVILLISWLWPDSDYSESSIGILKRTKSDVLSVYLINTPKNAHIFI